MTPPTEFIQVVVGIVVLVGAYSIYSAQVKKGVDKELLGRKSELEKFAIRQKQLAMAELNLKEIAIRDMEQALASKQSLFESMKAAFDNDYISGRKWLAEFLAETYEAPDIARAWELIAKTQPARKAAEEVRSIAKEKKELLRKNKLLEYTLKTYHEYYPILEEYSEDILNEQATLLLDDQSSDDVDPVYHYLSAEEYSSLSSTQRNQLALDKWKGRKKSNVEIGRLYERYLGYLYEDAGWSVEYFGATRGLEDMGRDLICSTETDIHVVQAKYWAQHRIIHEKHIFQLYGTAFLYPHKRTDIGSRKITAVFATTTSLSETAQWVARCLNVELRDDEMDHDYPMIKCNVNGNNKIYHLPFDQQYDRVKIDVARGESYVQTVAEAERRGFRRAMWHRA